MSNNHYPMTEKLVAYLNTVLATEPVIISSIFEYRLFVNPASFKHSNVVTINHNETHDLIGVIGIINGMVKDVFNEDCYVAAMFNSDTPNGKIEEFVLIDRKPSDEPQLQQ